MKLSDTANVVDVEHDNGRLIEIGLTTVSLRNKTILQSHSLPIKPDFDLSPEISQLTGWTTAKLKRQGITKEEANRRLAGYGLAKPPVHSRVLGGRDPESIASKSLLLVRSDAPTPFR